MKNKTMRIATVLLALTLVTSCFVSGTFAKYVTGGEASDNARVAKFGVVIEAAEDTLFNDSYKDDFITTYDADEEGASITVQADTEGTNVLAPGTNHTLTNALTITGTPEVDVEIAYTADLTLTGWEVEDEYYCPLVFTIGDTNYDGADYESAAAFEEAVEGAIVALSAEHVDANTDLAGTNDLTIGWAWAFEGDDESDTALGDAAAAGNAATVAIEYTLTVTQID